MQSIAAAGVALSSCLGEILNSWPTGQQGVPSPFAGIVGCRQVKSGWYNKTCQQAQRIHAGAPGHLLAI
jgi:hypothetical protein